MAAASLEMIVCGDHRGDVAGSERPINVIGLTLRRLCVLPVTVLAVSSLRLTFAAGDGLLRWPIP
jgi:hypothetical protein